MTISNGESFGCCGYWKQYCAAARGCKYLAEDFEFASLCSVFKNYYIKKDAAFIKNWEGQLDENGELKKKQESLLEKIQNNSVDDIMKLLGL
jgi:hypothetical protein